MRCGCCRSPRRATPTARAVGQRLRGLPEFKEIGDFFTDELRAQLRDAKSMTTSKLDAPVNKAAQAAQLAVDQACPAEHVA